MAFIEERGLSSVRHCAIAGLLRAPTVCAPVRGVSTDTPESISSVSSQADGEPFEISPTVPFVLIEEAGMEAGLEDQRLQPLVR